LFRKRDEDAIVRPPWEELETTSFEDPAVSLADVTVTRSRAIKLAGAALASSVFGLVVAGEADARRRRRKKRRKKRRRKARVDQPVPTLVPGAPTVLNVTNPGDNPLTVSGARLLDGAGNVVDSVDLTDPVTIEPHTEAPVTVTFDGPLTGATSLQLLDGQGRPVNVTNGDTDGNVPVTVSA
jgi:hypothetical protein